MNLIECSFRIFIITCFLKFHNVFACPFAVFQKQRQPIYFSAIVTVNTEKEVHVFTPDSDSTRIIIKSPSGQLVEAIIESTPTGLRVRFTPSEIGDYSIDVTYEDYPIEASPFLLQAVPDFGDPAACCSEAEYQVTASGKGSCSLTVRFRAPSSGTSPRIRAGSWADRQQLPIHSCSNRRNSSRVWQHRRLRRWPNSHPYSLHRQSRWHLLDVLRPLSSGYLLDSSHVRRTTRSREPVSSHC